MFASVSRYRDVCDESEIGVASGQYDVSSVSSNDITKPTGDVDIRGWVDESYDE